MTCTPTLGKTSTLFYLYYYKIIFFVLILVLWHDMTGVRSIMFFVLTVAGNDVRTNKSHAIGPCSYQKTD